MLARTIAIIDYGAGNVFSVEQGVRRASDNQDDVIHITHDLDHIARASHIILPGVGAFGDCISALKAQHGLIELLEERVLRHNVAFLGICVGMQMLFETGHEHGTYKGLGWLKGEVKQIASPQRDFKIPHMGWNTLQIQSPHDIVDDVASGEHVYFVHSYQAYCDSVYQVATTDYGAVIPAIVAHHNIIGMQFHPEKSQHVGHKLLENFLKIG